MWSTLFWVLVGVVIGWNLPQPDWAKSLQERVLGVIKAVGKPSSRDQAPKR